MDHGWIRVREAAELLSVSETTVRRRIADGQLRGRTGKSGRREVYVPASVAKSHHADQPVRSIAGSSEPHPQTATDDAERDALIQRYERMAGGSLMLAQQRADELYRSAEAAYENLAHTRHQLRQLRKIALVGWASCAVVLAVGVVCTLVLGIGGAKAKASARANAALSQQARQDVAALRDELARAEDLATYRSAQVPTYND